MQTSPVSDPIRNAIETVVREALGPFGLREVKVSPAFDHEGEAVLQIDLIHDLSARPIDPKVTFELPASLREKLQALGEDRFPHLRYHFDKRQKVVGWDG